MRVAKRFLVSGRVQGVGFRYFTQQSADRLGIDGWARNSPDGRVEIEAAGEPEALEKFESGLWFGPPGSRVAGVEVSNLADSGTNHGFHVR